MPISIYSGFNDQFTSPEPISEPTPIAIPKIKIDGENLQIVGKPIYLFIAEDGQPKVETVTKSINLSTEFLGQVVTINNYPIESTIVYVKPEDFELAHYLITETIPEEPNVNPILFLKEAKTHLLRAGEIPTLENIIEKAISRITQRFNTQQFHLNILSSHDKYLLQVNESERLFISSLYESLFFISNSDLRNPHRIAVLHLGQFSLTDIISIIQYDHHLPVSNEIFLCKEQLPLIRVILQKLMKLNINDLENTQRSIRVPAIAITDRYEQTGTEVDTINTITVPKFSNEH